MRVPVAAATPAPSNSLRDIAFDFFIDLASTKVPGLTANEIVGIQRLRHFQ
jgi:hypothetical protein